MGVADGAEASLVSDRPSCAVIGAGIVGACIAYELAERGHQVTLLEGDEPGSGCSFGNAGAISEWSVVPLALPGVIAGTPAMLRDPDGPLHLPLSYLPRALPWLARFLASARPATVERNAARLAALNANAGTLHERLAQRIGAPELVVRRGHVYVYPDTRAVAKDHAGWALRRAHGCRPVQLDRAAMAALEPALGPQYRVGLALPDQAFVVNPLRYVRSIVEAFQARGGGLLLDPVRGLARQGAGWRVDATGGAHEAQHVVIAAGMAAKRLLRKVGISAPLESQRGYHAVFHDVPCPITRVVMLADRKAFMTPMEDGLRIAGTVEFGGLERPPDMRRARLLERVAREAIAGLDGARVTHWMGHRPCMPDSVPWVGPVPGRAGLWMAIGHGHLGLTQAPASARRIAEGIGAASA